MDNFEEQKINEIRSIITNKLDLLIQQNVMGKKLKTIRDK